MKPANERMPYVNRSRTLKMTRMHFEAIAEVLRDAKPGGARTRPTFQMWELIVKAMAMKCGAANGGFNRERFYRACGLEE